jgi:hypothetical protein
VFEVLCEEKSGYIWRTVSFLSRSIQSTMDMAERLSAMGADSFTFGRNAHVVLLDPANLFFQVDNVGLIAVMPWDTRALHCHIAFWDKRLRGRERLCRNLAEFVVGVTRKHLVTAIPEDRRVVIAFAKRAGFEISHRRNGVVVLNFTNYRE